VLPFLIAAVALSAITAITDLRTGRIPNSLTLGGIVLGVLGHTIRDCWVGGLQAGLQAGAVSIGGLLLCSLAPAFMYWKGGMGGGDLKLYAAIGALCLPMLGIEAQMYSLVVAAIAAPARLAYEGRLFRVLGGSLALLFNPLRPRDQRRPIPEEAMTWFRLGPAIFAGTALTLVVHAYASGAL
jgi:prepilin peptidase CpaA